MLAITGFLPATDPRMLATIDAIDQRLTDARGLVHRYRTETGVDGLAREEGTFLLCTFWLAQTLALAGRVDSTTGELLGNFPQAFSHIGPVNAAWAISEA